MNYIKTTNVVCEICNQKEHSIEYCKTKDYSYQSCDNIFKINKCLKCDLLYLENQPNYLEYDLIYNSKYKAYSSIYNNYFSFFFRNATYIANFLKYIKLKKIIINSDFKILEIGSGNGQLISIIQRNKNIKFDNISIIETNKDLSSKFKEKGYDSHNCSFEVFESNRNYDLIIANQVFEHLKNPKTVINKLKKILKPKGILFLETPNFDCLENKIFNNSYWGGIHAPRHMYIFNLKSLKKLFEDNGFKIKKKEFVLSPYTLYETIKINIFKDKVNVISKMISIYNPIFLVLYCFIDLFQILLTGKNSNLRIIVEKK